jgi:hypothetical protein
LAIIIKILIYAFINLKKIIMRILHIIVVLVLVFSCTPDDYEMFDNQVGIEEIKFIELRADSDRMIANDEALMEFRIIAYGIREIKDLYKEEFNNEIAYRDSLRIDTFIIAEDQYPRDLIKIYDDQGGVIENNQFKITEFISETISFQAKLDNLESNILDIIVREVSEDNYEEIVLPVIFHLLSPPSHSVPAMKVTTEVMQGKLDVLNTIFNKQRTTNPNGGNAKITFKLAKFDINGVLLREEGLNIVNLNEKLTPNENLAYMKDNLMWDPNRYFNIWIGNMSNYWSSDGSQSFKVELPNVILEEEEVIPGIEADPVVDYDLTEDTELTDVGIVYDREEFLKASGLDNDKFDLAAVIGKYLGLFSMKVKIEWQNDPEQGWIEVPLLVNGDSDYCDDTAVYDYAYSLYKENYNTGEYFTSFNIMSDYSRTNSITVDQVSRIREVLEKCPSRWAYKSDWAFIGN